MCFTPNGQPTKTYCRPSHWNARYLRESSCTWNWKYASLRSNSPKNFFPANDARMSGMCGSWNLSSSSICAFTARTSRQSRMPVILPFSSFFGTANNGELNLVLAGASATFPAFSQRAIISEISGFTDSAMGYCFRKIFDSFSGLIVTVTTDRGSVQKSENFSFFSNNGFKAVNSPSLFL